MEQLPTLMQTCCQKWTNVQAKLYQRQHNTVLVPLKLKAGYHSTQIKNIHRWQNSMHRTNQITTVQKT